MIICERQCRNESSCNGCRVKHTLECGRIGCGDEDNCCCNIVAPLLKERFKELTNKIEELTNENEQLLRDKIERLSFEAESNQEGGTDH